MIKNVVFDMGGVLMEFDGRKFARHFATDEADVEALNKAIFDNATWPLLDAGVVSENTVLTLALERLPERLRPTARDLFAHWHLYQPVKQDTNDLVVRLHDAGYHCFLLSNAGIRWWHQKDRIPSFPCMDGWMVSAWEHLMKPDPAIYRLFCDRFGLEPAECLFVDDNADNVRGAKAAGMQGHVFTTAAELEGHLRAQGIEL